jgi:hypothetical protein
VIRSPTIESPRSQRSTIHFILESFWSAQMYDMYPEWGPSRHRDDEEGAASQQPVQYGLDLRDGGGQRPDYN